MTTRKRTSKRSKAQTNSNIQSAQRASVEKRLAAQEAQKSKAAANKGAAPKKGALPADKQNSTISAGNPPLTDPKVQAAQDSVNSRNSSTLTKSTLEQNNRPNGLKMSDVQAANSNIAGLAMNLYQQHVADAGPQRKLADASLYGQSDAKRAQNITERTLAISDAKRADILKKGGNAVWLGTTKKTVQIRNNGPERFDENGGTTTSQQVETNADVRTKDELMSWLTDDKMFNQIKKKMTDAGIQVQSYDDVAKLWQSVVDQASAAYSTIGKKVTPWALISMRGKSMVNGKPAPKTTTSTNIEEMDPAQAKVMIKNSLSQMLGRDPKQSEIEDFISKAQTIAAQNPQVTKTTTQYDVLGNPTDQTSVSSGGQDVVTAKAQLAAEEQAKQSEDYASYQGAGVYMPWLMDALSAPV